MICAYLNSPSTFKVLPRLDHSHILSRTAIPSPLRYSPSPRYPPAPSPCNFIVAESTPRSPSSGPSKISRKMLVVDMQELLRTTRNSSPDSDIQRFKERVEVERNSSKSPTYLVYSSSSTYPASMQSMAENGLIEPDALVTLSGTELYQKGYRTPDPYWAEQVQSGWTPKPVEWTISKFFKSEVEDVSVEDDIIVKVQCKGIGPSADFCSRVKTKLTEMGIWARVILDDEHNVMIMPAVGSPCLVVLFCQSMLGIEESSTFVFGGDDLINDCVQGKSNVGLCPAGSLQRWDAFDGRVYISKDFGMKALMDGVLHHAVF